MVNFSSGGGNPPYFQSASDERWARSYREGDIREGEDDDDPIVFYYGGQWSEFPATSGVPAAEARIAMRAFFAGGELPTNLRWNEV